MAEFGASEQSLLRSLREGDEPSEADRARVARRLESELSIALGAGGVLLTVSATTLSSSGAGGTVAAGLSGQALGTASGLGAGAAAGSGSAVAAGGALWATPLAKWGALALLGWGAGWGVNELVQDRTPKAVPAVVVPAAALPVVAVPARAEPAPRDEATPAVALTPETQPERPASSFRTIAPSAGAQTKVAASADQLEAELQLIGEAQRALSEQAPARALAALAQHARQYPRGTLRVERAALNSIALCQAGQLTRGRESAERFAAQNPGSPLLGRVQRACGSAQE